MTAPTTPTIPDATPAPIPTAEPGWSTTEYWVTVLTVVVGLLTAIGVIHVPLGSPAVTSEIQVFGGLFAMIVPAAAYAIGRSIRKSGTQG